MEEGGEEKERETHTRAQRKEGRQKERRGEMKNREWHEEGGEGKVGGSHRLILFMPIELQASVIGLVLMVFFLVTLSPVFFITYMIDR